MIIPLEYGMQHGTQIHQLDGHSDYVYSVSLSPDGTKIVSGSRDSSIRVWDAVK